MTRPGPPARRLGVGVALAGLYAAVVAGTLATTSRRVLPLFQGYAPPRPYNWVRPPPQFASRNVVPRPMTTHIEFEAAGSRPAQIATEDTQLALSLGLGAIPRREGDTNVTATITPLDPSTLGPLPQGLRPDGNAYRVDLAYAPSGQPVTALAAGGGSGLASANVVITAPQRVRALLFSADGRSWEPLAMQPLGDPNVVGATFSRPGHYLAAIHAGDALVPPEEENGPGSPATVALVAGLVAGLALCLALAPIAWWRSRRSAPVREGPTGRRPPPAGTGRRRSSRSSSRRRRRR